MNDDKGVTVWSDDSFKKDPYDYMDKPAREFMSFFDTHKVEVGNALHLPPGSNKYKLTNDAMDNQPRATTLGRSFVSPYNHQKDSATVIDYEPLFND